MNHNAGMLDLCRHGVIFIQIRIRNNKYTNKSYRIENSKNIEIV